MKFNQENMPYNPITITLENLYEAEALRSIMDKICECVASEGREIKPDHISQTERGVAVIISNAFTMDKVII